MGYTNSQCPHVWAQQTKEKGQTNNGNLFFEGRTIYSYGYHFPIASYQERKKKAAVFVNDDKYSVSTTQHQSDVRHAISGGNTIIYCDTAILKAITTADITPTKDSVQRYCKRLKDEQLEALKKASRARTYVNYHISDAHNAAKKARELCEFFGLHIPAWTKQTVNDDLIAAALTASKREAAANKRKKAATLKSCQKEVKEWLACENDFLPAAYRNYGCDVLLRVNHAQNRIETSQGAQFPIDAATQAFKIVKLCRAKGQEFKRNGENIRLGHFMVDSISKTGDVKAACHFVKWPAIKHAADILGLS